MWPTYFFFEIICIHRPYRCHVALNSMCRADLFARLQELVESSGITKVEKPWDRQRMGGLGETGRCHWPWQHPDQGRPILWVEAFGAFWADFWAQNLASYYRIFIYIYIHSPVFWWFAHWFVSAITCFSAFRIFSAGWRMSQVRDHHSAAWILQWCVQSLVLSCIISSGHIRMGGHKYLLIIYL